LLFRGSVLVKRAAGPKLHLSSQDPVEQAGAHAYSVDSTDCQTLFGGREAGVMVETQDKDHSLSPMCVEIG
jgi:hypothetical protein